MNRTRALALPNNEIGQKRYELYKNAFDHINQSIESKYYLEAITLIESLITDRLESRLSFLLDEDFSFKTLGKIIEKSRQIEQDENLKALISKDLDEWRKHRNTAVHEMVKLEENQQTTWENRNVVLEKVAQDGYQLLKELNKQTSKLRGSQ